MDLKKVGSLIKQRREFLHLRQEDLSELSKVANKTIHMIEQGNGNPSFETLSKLSEVLGLEILVQVKKTN